MYGHEEKKPNTTDTEQLQTFLSYIGLALPINRFETTITRSVCVYLSKEVDFQTKSTTKLCVHSEGTPALLFSSMATSSL